MKKILLATLWITQCITAAQTTAITESVNTTMPTIEKTNNGEVAIKLANPVEPMITLPFQFNYDNKFKGISSEESNRWTLNIQPVVPFDLNDEWNIISRTIAPIVRTDNLPFGSGINAGVGDIAQSFFLSPKAPSASGWVWGAGLITLIPSDSDFSAKKWGLGPTAVALKQVNGWTYGALFNHIWSVGGSDAVVKSISTTMFQPFLTYTTPKGISYSTWTETLYNWEADSDNRWTVPLFAGLSQVGQIGNQRISYGAFLKYNAKTPFGAAEDFGIRFTLTFIFPK